MKKEKKKKKNGSAGIIFTVSQIHFINENGLLYNIVIERYPGDLTGGNIKTVVVYSSALLVLHSRWGVRNG